MDNRALGQLAKQLKVPRQEFSNLIQSDKGLSLVTPDWLQESMEEGTLLDSNEFTIQLGKGQYQQKQGLYGDEDLGNEDTAQSQRHRQRTTSKSRGRRLNYQQEEDSGRGGNRQKQGQSRQRQGDDMFDEDYGGQRSKGGRTQSHGASGRQGHSTNNYNEEGLRLNVDGTVDKRQFGPFNVARDPTGSFVPKGSIEDPIEEFDDSKTKLRGQGFGEGSSRGQGGSHRNQSQGRHGQQQRSGQNQSQQNRHRQGKGGQDDFDEDDHELRHNKDGSIDQRQFAHGTHRSGGGQRSGQSKTRGRQGRSQQEDDDDLRHNQDGSVDQRQFGHNSYQYRHGGQGSSNQRSGRSGNRRQDEDEDFDDQNLRHNLDGSIDQRQFGHNSQRYREQHQERSSGRQQNDGLRHNLDGSIDKRQFGPFNVDRDPTGSFVPKGSIEDPIDEYDDSKTKLRGQGGSSGRSGNQQQQRSGGSQQQRSGGSQQQRSGGYQQRSGQGRSGRNYEEDDDQELRHNKDGSIDQRQFAHGTHRSGRQDSKENYNRGQRRNYQDDDDDQDLRHNQDGSIDQRQFGHNSYQYRNEGHSGSHQRSGQSQNRGSGGQEGRSGHYGSSGNQGHSTNNYNEEGLRLNMDGTVDKRQFGPFNVARDPTGSFVPKGSIEDPIDEYPDSKTKLGGQGYGRSQQQRSGGSQQRSGQQQQQRSGGQGKSGRGNYQQDDDDDQDLRHNQDGSIDQRQFGHNSYQYRNEGHSGSHQRSGQSQNRSSGGQEGRSGRYGSSGNQGHSTDNYNSEGLRLNVDGTVDKRQFGPFNVDRDETGSFVPKGSIDDPIDEYPDSKTKLGGQGRSGNSQQRSGGQHQQRSGSSQQQRSGQGRSGRSGQSNEEDDSELRHNKDGSIDQRQFAHGQHRSGRQNSREDTGRSQQYGSNQRQGGSSQNRSSGGQEGRSQGRSGGYGSSGNQGHSTDNYNSEGLRLNVDGTVDKRQFGPFNVDRDETGSFVPKGSIEDPIDEYPDSKTKLGGQGRSGNSQQRSGGQQQQRSGSSQQQRSGQGRSGRGNQDDEEDYDDQNLRHNKDGSIDQRQFGHNSYQSRNQGHSSSNQRQGESSQNRSSGGQEGRSQNRYNMTSGSQGHSTNNYNEEGLRLNVDGTVDKRQFGPFNVDRDETGSFVPKGSIEDPIDEYPDSKTKLGSSGRSGNQQQRSGDSQQRSGNSQQQRSGRQGSSGRRNQQEDDDNESDHQRSGGSRGQQRTHTKNQEYGYGEYDEEGLRHNKDGSIDKRQFRGKQFQDDDEGHSQQQKSSSQNNQRSTGQGRSHRQGQSNSESQGHSTNMYNEEGLRLNQDGSVDKRQFGPYNVDRAPTGELVPKGSIDQPIDEYPDSKTKQQRSSGRGDDQQDDEGQRRRQRQKRSQQDDDEDEGSTNQRSSQRSGQNKSSSNKQGGSQNQSSNRNQQRQNEGAGGDDEEDDEEYVPSDSELEEAEKIAELQTIKKGGRESQATQESEQKTKQSNKMKPMNERIVQELEKIKNLYEVQGDQGKSISYTKAINFLQTYEKPIEDADHLDELPNIGDNIKEDIREFLKEGKTEDLLEDDLKKSISQLEREIDGEDTSGSRQQETTKGGDSGEGQKQSSASQKA